MSVLNWGVWLSGHVPKRRCANQKCGFVPSRNPPVTRSCPAMPLDVIIAWNKGARLMFGCSEEDILGQPLSKIVPDGLRMLSRDDMTEMMHVPPALLGRTMEAVGLAKLGRVLSP